MENNLEFEKLRSKVNELQAVKYNKDKEIEILNEDLKIKLVNYGKDYDYWTWEIETPSLKIFISTTNQSLYLFIKSKNYHINTEININYNYIEQDLFICNKAEYAYEEIVEIIKVYHQFGEKGILEKFLGDYLYALI